MKTLHFVQSVAECSELLEQVDIRDRLEYLLYGDKEGWSALQTAVLRDNHGVAQLIIQSVSDSDRRGLLLYADTDIRTALMCCQSAEMVQTLLNPLSDDDRQEVIKVQDKWGLTVANYMALACLHKVLKAVLFYCNSSTKHHLLTCRDYLWGRNMVVSAGHGGNREIIKLTVDMLSDSESDNIEKTIISSTNYGETIIHQMIVFQCVGDLARVLYPIGIEQRKHLLTTSNLNNFTPQQLSLVPPSHIRENSGEFLTIYNPSSIEDVHINSKLLVLLHQLCNQYPIHDLWSVIKCRLAADPDEPAELQVESLSQHNQRDRVTTIRLTGLLSLLTSVIRVHLIVVAVGSGETE